MCRSTFQDCNPGDSVVCVGNVHLQHNFVPVQLGHPVHGVDQDFRTSTDPKQGTTWGTCVQLPDGEVGLNRL
jgi:hypothetical protein